MQRRDFLHLMTSSAAAAALGPLASRAGAAQASDRPNTVCIMSDDHASHAMSCYGSRINKTPNLDRIANEGVRFDNCFCTNSLCAPSRAVILTSKYSHLNGIVDNGKTFDGSQTTFPKVLQQAGYQTAMVGKWHLQSDPTGFDYWCVLPGQGAYHDPVMIEQGERKQFKGYVSDLITDKCFDWLKQRDRSKPFCLLYWHKAPHRNWQPAERYKDLYEDVDIPIPEAFDDEYATRCDAAREQAMTIERHLTKSDVKQDPPAGLEGEALKKWKYERYIKDYLRCVASVDDNVGRMLKYLDDEGLAENTVVMYTSDQGFFLGDHGWFDKRWMYEESLRMPLVMRYPKAVKAGTVNKDLVLNLDFGPTFLDFAGAAQPAEMQGRSFRLILEGTTPADWRQSMYYHYYEYPGAHSVKRHYGIRTDRYKLIHFYYDIDAWEFYDLQKDPHELNNICADPANAQLIADLKVELGKLRKQYGDSDENAQQFLPGKGQPPSKGLQLRVPLDDPAEAKLAQNLASKQKESGLAYVGTTVVEGRKGKARRFNGTTDRLELDRTDTPNPANTPVTVAAWIKPEKPTGTVLAHGGETWGYLLHLLDGKPAFTTSIDDTATTVTGSDKLPGGWVHLAGQLRDKGAMVLLVNGKVVAEGKAPGLLAAKPNDGLQIGADTGSRVGRLKGDSAFGGVIDELTLLYGETAGDLWGRG